ncbi:LAQU0S06e04610g1_1 [Lachancea quebecensis]|uniref:LAQU0S06e04610g1_1 n=1 Tax=Lachancea quebecensis TaxID=1654605 RepID=A0A0P1KSK9_9SACH|nr:LAQU0S06e04610g1_1 [Lachancea quebecensis]
MRPLLGTSGHSLVRRTVCGVSHSARNANLGQMTEYLRLEAVPQMLSRSIDAGKLDTEIRLRLLPTTHPYLPSIQGVNKYKHSMNAIALVIRNFVLNERCALHVTNVQTLADGRARARYNTVTDADTVVVHWSTCTEGCEHLGPEGVTSQAKFGLYKARQASRGAAGLEDEHSKSEVLRYILDPGHKMSEKLMEQHASPADDLDARWQLSRVIHGVFIFEMNHDNTKIRVHTIDNVEMSDREKKVETGALAC